MRAQCRLGRHLLALGLLAILATPGVACAEPSRLDLARFRLTFSEEFNDLDVSKRGPGSKWIAHTPWNGDFGDAEFTDPGPTFPFTTKGGILRIEARKDAAGKWRSGLLCSGDNRGNGFSQAMGYFEARMKLPTGPGTWPAFWLSGWNEPAPEIDVIEYYGHMPSRYSINTHVWQSGTSVAAETKQVDVPEHSLETGFNTYGVLIEDDMTRFYLNREEVWRVPTRPEFKKPLRLLVNLALGSGFPIDRTPNPSVLEVDYIRAYAAKKGG